MPQAEIVIIVHDVIAEVTILKQSFSVNHTAFICKLFHPTDVYYIHH